MHCCPRRRDNIQTKTNRKIQIKTQTENRTFSLSLSESRCVENVIIPIPRILCDLFLMRLLSIIMAFEQKLFMHSTHTPQDTSHNNVLRRRLRRIAGKRIQRKFIYSTFFVVVILIELIPLISFLLVHMQCVIRPENLFVIRRQSPPPTSTPTAHTHTIFHLPSPSSKSLINK